MQSNCYSVQLSSIRLDWLKSPKLKIKILNFSSSSKSFFFFSFPVQNSSGCDHGSSTWSRSWPTRFQCHKTPHFFGHKVPVWSWAFSLTRKYHTRVKMASTSKRKFIIVQMLRNSILWWYLPKLFTYFLRSF
jgi:hypothetical protein